MVFSWLNENAYVPQGVKLLEITQNRITEKQAIVEAGVEVAPYTVINKEDDILNGIKELRLSCCVKNSKMEAMTVKDSLLFANKTK